MTAKPQVVVLNGNKAAAYGARLARVQVTAAYPITPQTPLVEYLASFIANGDLDADMVEVESEHSALSVLHGAVLAGSRTFTGTSSQGLALMYEPYIRTSTLRLPIVMCIATREVISPQTVWGGQQDALTVRDAGWIQIYVENNQELLDTVIMAFRIAEDKRVLLPINVCYDGFYLSHMTERVELPPQELVDEFLPPYKPEHVVLDPQRPMAVDPLTPGDLLMRYRLKHVRALERARDVIVEVEEEYRRFFGRKYHGLIERYRCDDASILLMTLGSMTGTARVAVDEAREQNIPVGLVKLRVLRPIPRAELWAAFKGKAAVGVVDRNVSFGWGTGITYMELLATLSGMSDRPLMLDFIAGLGGSDITLDHFRRVISLLHDASMGKPVKEVTWLALESGGASDELKRLERDGAAL